MTLKQTYQRALAQILIEHGWLDAHQSNSAHAMAQAICQLKELSAEDRETIAEILDVVLEHNHDPHDTDLAGTAVALLDLVKRHSRGKT
jgi:hypothetical protein